MRSSIRIKLAVVGFTLVVAIGYLLMAGVKGGWVYFVHVDQLTTQQQHNPQRIRIHGQVGTDNFIVQPAALMAKFKIVGKTNSVMVDYHGPIPDLFKQGCQVVVEGRFDNAGVLHADVLMTKCGSKYEEGSPHAKATQQ